MFISYGAGMSLGVEGEVEDYKLATQYIHRFNKNGDDVFYPVNIKSDSKVFSPLMGMHEKNQFDSKEYFEYAQIAFATFWVEAAKKKLISEHKSLNKYNIICTMHSTRKDMLNFMCNVGPGLGKPRVTDGKSLSDRECVDLCEEDLKYYVIDPKKENTMEQYLLNTFKGNRERTKILWEIKTKCCGGRVIEKVKRPETKHKSNEKDYGPTM